jgi:hypothetical protein
MNEQQIQLSTPSHETDKVSLISFSDPTEKWIQLLFQRGPLGVIAVGGAMALTKGILPTFEIREATFGAVLLLLAAIADCFVWIAKRQAARQRVERTEKHRDIADAAYQEAEASLAATMENDFTKQVQPSDLTGKK